jgi:hypothetical protein
VLAGRGFAGSHDQVAAHRPRAFVVMRVRRQTAIGELDVPAIEERAAAREGNEPRRITMFGDADDCRSLQGLSFCYRLRPLPSI